MMKSIWLICVTAPLFLLANPTGTGKGFSHDTGALLDQYIDSPILTNTPEPRAATVLRLTKILASEYQLDDEAIVRIEVALTSYHLVLADLAERDGLTEAGAIRLKAEVIGDIENIISSPASKPSETSNLLSDCQAAADLLDQAISAIDDAMDAIGNPGCDAWATEVWYKLESARVNLPNLLSEISGDPRPCNYTATMKSRYDYAKSKAATALSYGYSSSCLSAGILSDLANINNLINDAATYASMCCDGGS